jgi:hypothetical protein
MQLFLYATEIIEGKTYTTAKSTIDEKNCRAPMDAEHFVVELVNSANVQFDRVRQKQFKNSSSKLNA